MWSNKLNDMGLRAVTGSADFSARVWDALTGLELHQFPHKHIVRTVDFAHRSNRIVTGGECRAVLRLQAARLGKNVFCCFAMLRYGIWASHESMQPLLRDVAGHV